MKDTLFANSLRFLGKEFLGDFVAFPLWWYSKGTLKMIRFVMEKTEQRAYTLSLRIWIKNLFVPMYSQYDLAGRVISFFLRIAVLVYRLIIFVIWFCILLAFLGVWLFGPIAVLYYILYQIFGVTLAL